MYLSSEGCHTTFGRVGADGSNHETIVSADQVSSVPQKTQNRAETLVLVHDKDTIVLGGLRTANFSDTTDSVPLLGSIPLLGRLFRSPRKNHAHSELLIFITTTRSSALI